MLIDTVLFVSWNLWETELRNISMYILHIYLYVYDHKYLYIILAICEGYKFNFK